METAIQSITREREDNQIKNLGFDLKYDLEKNSDGRLLRLAQFLISADTDYKPWGFTDDYVNQFFLKSRDEQLVIAAALVAAHIDIMRAIQSSNNG